jgi:hypothetical protein
MASNVSVWLLLQGQGNFFYGDSGLVYQRKFAMIFRNLMQRLVLCFVEVSLLFNNNFIEVNAIIFRIQGFGQHSY